MRIELATLTLVISLCWLVDVVAEENSSPQLRAAVQRSLSLLETASAGTAENRVCFTCHGQALPVIAIVESAHRGFTFDAENLKRQVEHTYAHLKRGRKSYSEGKGQGGGVDTAGYALWTLEDGGRKTDDIVTMVTDWLLTKQTKSGFWRRSSNRPPSEASNFTSTYLALRALSHFGTKEQRDEIETATEAAIQWLVQAEAKDTEDQVFRLLSFHYGDVPNEIQESAIDRLRQQQRADGGWSQTADMESDAYATATALYALSEVGAIQREDDVWITGVKFLLNQQHDDGSWLVESRSKPFQKYFESGFPHKKHQFISTSATAWATLVLAQSLPVQADSASESKATTSTRE